MNVIQKLIQPIILYYNNQSRGLGGGHRSHASLESRHHKLLAINNYLFFAS